jgi:hypothetical protein
VEQAGKGSYVDQKQKMGYDQSLATTAQEISHMLGKVSSVDGNISTIIKELVRQAAKFWLDMGSQRCRIVVVLPKLAENTSDARRRERRALELVVKPEVRRIGNSQGQQLEKQEVIGGCQEEHSTFHLHW